MDPADVKLAVYYVQVNVEEYLSMTDLLPAVGADPQPEQRDASWKSAGEWAERYWDQWHAMLTEGGRHATGGGYLGLIRFSEELGKRLEKARGRFDGNLEYIVKPWHERFPPDVLDEQIRQHDREMWVLEARASALRSFLRLFEEGGIAKTWADLKGKAEGGAAPAVSGRGAQYLGAVLALRGRPFRNATKFFEAVADLSPRPGGDPPTGNAAWLWMTSKGFVRKGEPLGMFRPRLEQEAERLLGSSNAAPEIEPSVQTPP